MNTAVSSKTGESFTDLVARTMYIKSTDELLDALDDYGIDFDDYLAGIAEMNKEERTESLDTLDKTFAIGRASIGARIRFDEVVNYNEEHGRDNNDIRGICVNVMGNIGECPFYGQVQWDSLNNEYSTDCDGNALYGELKTALLSNFDDKELHDEQGMATDLHCELMNETLPGIVRAVCDFAETYADAYRIA